MTRINSISSTKHDRMDLSLSTHTDYTQRNNDDQRSIFTVEKLNTDYNLNQDFDDNPCKSTWNYVRKYYTPTSDFFKRQLFKRVPFLDWIRHYNVKECLLSDIISGLTIGIVHIPQGS
jgi:hypothetical protein